MSDKRFTHIRDLTSPDDAVVDALMNKLAAQPSGRTPKLLVKRLAVVGLCLLLVGAAVVVVTVGGKPERAVDVTPNIAAIRGLPVDEFIGAEPNAAYGCITSPYVLADFVIAGAEAFAVVRVQEIVQQPLTYINVVRAETLTQLYGDAPLPDAIVIGTRERRMRVGGVYVLPLQLVGGFYQIADEFEALLEIDDNGLVYTHATSGEIKSYEGQPVESLCKDVQALADNPALDVASSPFGVSMRNFTHLAVVTITSSPNTHSAELTSNLQRSYRATVKQVLAGDLSVGELDIVFYGITYETPTLAGGDYLVFLYHSQGVYYASAHRYAPVDGDGRLGKPAGRSLFDEYVGQNVAQMEALADMTLEVGLLRPAARGLVECATVEFEDLDRHTEADLAMAAETALADLARDGKADVQLLFYSNRTGQYNEENSGKYHGHPASQNVICFMVDYVRQPMDAPLESQAMADAGRTHFSGQTLKVARDNPDSPWVVVSLGY